MSSRRAFLAGSLAALFARPALGRPVPTGRFVRIPHGVPDDHPWRTGGGSPRRDFRCVTLIPAAPPTKRWEVRVGVGRVFAPALSREGLLFVASQAGVGCVDPSGRVLWLLRVGLASGTPAFTPEGEVAVGIAPGEVGIVGAGGLRVLARLGGAVRGSPLVLDDGSVVVAAQDQAVHRIGADGQTLFRAPVATQVSGGVTQIGPSLLALPAERSVVFVELDGRTRTVVELPAPVVLDLAATEAGEVFAMLADGTLCRLAPSGIRGMVRTRVAPLLSSALCVAPDRTVRFGTREHGWVAVTPDGTVRPGLAVHRGVVDPQGVSLAVDVLGNLVAFEPDGTVRWQVSGVGRTDAAPVLGYDGTVYVATFGGGLAAFGA